MVAIMDELFDVFDDDPIKQDQDTSNKKRDKKDKKSRKRSLNGDVKQQNGDGEHVDTTGDAAEVDHALKKQKRETQENGIPIPPDIQRNKRNDEPAPVVTDAFETEQSREVAASAGLQASKEGTAVVLSHQVRHQVALPSDYDYTPISQHKACLLYTSPSPRD